MKTKKTTNKDRAILPKPAGDPRRRSTIDSNASKRVIKVDLPETEVFAGESVTKHIQKQTLRAFLDAVNIWRVNDADSARLVGAEPASVEIWKTGKGPISEEVLARMTMVALIRTALDITFPSSLSNAWMTVPNSGYPYLGLSPVAYVVEHGWPGLFWVLRQSQDAAIGN
jgi:hypothetical protein